MNENEEAASDVRVDVGAAAAAKTLRKALKRNKTLENGTVVRWQVAGQMTGRNYIYVALYVNGTWYVGGDGRYWGINTFTEAEFVEKVLGGNRVTDVRVAESWREV